LFIFLEITFFNFLYITINYQGIFFKYDIEPISVRIAENGTSFITFLVRLCGLVGGIWVTAGFAFKIINRIWSSLQKSISIDNGFTNFQKLSKE
jgi:hypothetical protein